MVRLVDPRSSTIRSQLEEELGRVVLPQGEISFRGFSLPQHPSTRYIQKDHADDSSKNRQAFSHQTKDEVAPAERREKQTISVLVTGGAGTSGVIREGACEGGAQALRSRQSQCRACWAESWGPFFEMDLAEKDKVSYLLKNQRIEAVMHFARGLWWANRSNCRANIIGTMS